MPSVMAAAMNNAEASNSFSPLTLLKRGLDRIQISRGMLAMRISVMELGRFTLRDGSGGQSETRLIMLHGKGERNAGSDSELPSDLRPLTSAGVFSLVRGLRSEV